MRAFLKKIIILFVVIIIGVLSCIRIIYVNSKQHVGEAHVYKAGESFECNGFQIEAKGVDYYDADGLRKLYPEITEEMLPETEMAIKLSVRNITDEERVLNISAFTTQVGIERGSSIDPYIYPYFNPQLSGGISLASEKTQTVILPFPIEKKALESKEQLWLILSLYPEKYEIKL